MTAIKIFDKGFVLAVVVFVFIRFCPIARVHRLAIWRISFVCGSLVRCDAQKIPHNAVFAVRCCHSLCCCFVDFYDFRILDRQISSGSNILSFQSICERVMALDLNQSERQERKAKRGNSIIMLCDVDANEASANKQKEKKNIYSSAVHENVQNICKYMSQRTERTQHTEVKILCRLFSFCASEKWRSNSMCCARIDNKHDSNGSHRFTVTIDVDLIGLKDVKLTRFVRSTE